MTSSLAGALIAGGASSRFGRDKASLPWAGGSLGAHLLSEMQKAGLSPLILNAAAELSGLPAGVRLVPDTEADQGPLAGLAAVLRSVDQPVLVAACDMPGLNARAFAALASAWDPQSLGLVASAPDGWQPLFAIYSPMLLPEIERRLALGQRALHRLIEDQKLLAWTQAEPAWLANVNTLEDWEAWKFQQAK